MADKSSKKKVLVVEDEAFLRELYQELLVEEGYDVELAVDGAEGMEKIEKGEYDMTLLDIMLPKRDGLTLMSDCKEKDIFENMGKIVLLTNLGQDAIIKKGFDAGAVGYLIKSAYTPDQILEEVHKFLD